MVYTLIFLVLRIVLYDYSARYYESAVGRFTSIDPHAEKYYSISPYAYCYNNPLKYIDPNGNDGILGILRTLYNIAKDIKNEAIEARVTVGLQAGGTAKIVSSNVGAEANLISTDVAGYSNGELFYPGKIGEVKKADKEFVKQGIGAGIGVFSFNMSDIEIERRSENGMVNEEKISVGIGPFSIEDTETKPINRNGE